MSAGSNRNLEITNEDLTEYKTFISCPSEPLFWPLSWQLVINTLLYNVVLHRLSVLDLLAQTIVLVAVEIK